MIEAGLRSVGLKVEDGKVVGSTMARIVDSGRRAGVARGYLSFEQELLEARGVGFWLSRARSLGVDLARLDQRDGAVHAIFDRCVRDVAAHLARGADRPVEERADAPVTDVSGQGSQLGAVRREAADVPDRAAETVVEPPGLAVAGAGEAPELRAARADGAPEKDAVAAGNSGEADGARAGTGGEEIGDPAADGQPFICFPNDCEVAIAFINPSHIKGSTNPCRRNLIRADAYVRLCGIQQARIVANGGVLPAGWVLPKGATLAADGQVLLGPNKKMYPDR